MRKDSSKLMKVNKRSEIKDKRRKDKEEFTDRGVADMLCKMMKQQSAPEIYLDVFDGNPLNFHYFMALFREAFKKKIEDPCGRLAQFIKYTTGEMKDFIKNYIQLPAEDGYEAAKNQLYQLYGDPHRVIAAYRKEIKHWAQVKHGDAKGYRRFLNFLLKCETITQMQTWNVLDTPEVMSRKVLGIRRKLKRDPELADLIDFVSDENLIVNDPVFSKDAFEHYIEKKPVKCSKKLSTHVAASTECHVLDHGDKTVKCINCAANLLLDNCPSCLEKTLREQISFLAEKKFCYACLQPMQQGHNAKTCDQRLSCRSCKGNHPTAMHRYIPKDKLRIDSSFGQNGDKKMTIILLM